MPESPQVFRHTQRVRETRTRNSFERGYDTAWKKLRNWYLSQRPLCVKCDAEGITKPAEEVDHIKPFDGSHDPLRLDPDNLQGLCRSHHVKKTWKDRTNGPAT